MAYPRPNTGSAWTGDCACSKEPFNLNPTVGNAGAAREAQFHCAAQLFRASPNG